MTSWEATPDDPSYDTGGTSVEFNEFMHRHPSLEPAHSQGTITFSMEGVRIDPGFVGGIKPRIDLRKIFSATGIPATYLRIGEETETQENNKMKRYLIEVTVVDPSTEKILVVEAVIAYGETEAKATEDAKLLVIQSSGYGKEYRDYDWFYAVLGCLREKKEDG